MGPVVVDRSPEMLARAAAKGLGTVEADAQQLPFADESFDAATMIAMLHHVDDHRAALAEVRRILKRAASSASWGFADEDNSSLWIVDYFPVSRPWMEATHPPRADFLEELPGARLMDFEFTDMRDASLAARSADPELMVEAAESGATSYFERCGEIIQTSCGRGSIACARTSPRAARRAVPPPQPCSAGRSPTY